MATSKILLGPIPHARYDWVSGASYGKEAIVFHKGSSYIALSDNPSAEPSFTYDPATGSYNVSAGWGLLAVGTAIVQETGDSQDKAMSQKAVTDALTASDQKLSKLKEKVDGIQGTIDAVITSDVITEHTRITSDAMEGVSVGRMYKNGKVNPLPDTMRYTPRIAVQDGDVIYIEQTQGTYNPVRACRYVCAYKNGEVIVDAGSDDNIASYLVKDGIDEVVISFSPYDGYTQTLVIERDITSYSTTIKKDAIPENAGIEIAINNAGKSALSIDIPTMSGGTKEISDFPEYIKRNKFVSFGCKLTTFSGLSIGFGDYTARGFALAVDGTNIVLKTINTNMATFAHGLSISTFIKVSVEHEMNNWKVVISTLGGMFVKEFDDSAFPQDLLNNPSYGYYTKYGELYFTDLIGKPFISLADGTSITDGKLSASSKEFRYPVWIFGDSYTSMSKFRWTYYMAGKCKYNEWLLSGLAGAKDRLMYEQLLYCLQFGTPKFLVWLLGMNDADNGAVNEDWLAVFNDIKSICERKGITLIAATVPCVPTRDNSFKNAVVKSSGLRYIDMAKTLRGEVYTQGVDNWYEGYLESNQSENIHPTELGAMAECSQILCDFPEIMQYY